MQGKYLLSICLVAGFLPTLVSAQEAGPKPTLVMLAMKDGTKLATDVYLPGKDDQKYPTIYSVGPYGRAGIRSFTKSVLKKGWAVVSQDMRGRGDSEGENAIIFHHHGWTKNKDGHDTLRWIAEQKWSDGNVATWGGSALGITQNMMSVNAPPSLKAQFVLVGSSNLYHQTAYQGGAFRVSLIEDWLKVTKMVPGNLAAFVEHSRYDQFWAELDPESQAEHVNAPGMYLGGWYDIFAQGTINSFVTIQEKGGPAARGRCRLFMGPIAHGKFNELTYPNAGFPKEHDFMRYFEWAVLGKNNGAEKDKPVHYYVMGDPTDKSAPGNVWRAADKWPPPATVENWYFHEDGKLTPTQSTSSDAKKCYTYDPKDPVRTVGGQNLVLPAGPMDQRRVEGRPDVLLFSSEVLKEPIEVTGRIFATLYVESDCPDTDFTVKLSDVYPDGRSMLVTDGILRARFHKGFESENFLEPNQAYEIKVDLWSTSIIFAKGHRIRIAVSSSNSPRFEANPNTGKPFRADKETRIAHNTIHLSKDRPSRIEFPIAGQDLGIGRR